MAVASSKQERGNGLGNKVIGAVDASTPVGSVSTGTKLAGGLTAKPCAIDQSLRVVKRYSDCSCERSGGYSGYTS